MRILLVADGRSPITLRFLEGLIAQGHSICFVSSFPCDPIPQLQDLQVIPVAFSHLAGSSITVHTSSANAASLLTLRFRRLVSYFRPIFMLGRYYLGPLSLFFSRDRTRFLRVVQNYQPDLIHALRIPFEGMLASFAPQDIPLVVSIWGNDLTLHARGSPMMSTLTRRTLRRTQGLLADASRDLRLGHVWGYPVDKPSLVVPGSMGIDLAEIASCKNRPFQPTGEPLPGGSPLVINPRGFRPGSIRQDTFFKAIPLVLDQNPSVTFLCPSMAGQTEALQWVKKLDIGSKVRLLPTLPQADLWALFHRSEVFVSPSVHDGVPNSFLESIACGCFPVVGDIESLREWISPGVNGLLVDPTNPQSLAEAILHALNSPDLRQHATEINANLISARAEVGSVRKMVKEFYEKLVQ